MSDLRVSEVGVTVAVDGPAPAIARRPATLQVAEVGLTAAVGGTAPVITRRPATLQVAEVGVVSAIITDRPETAVQTGEVIGVSGFLTSPLIIG